MELTDVYTLINTSNTHLCISQNNEIRYIIQNSEIGKKSFIQTFNPYSKSKDLLKYGLKILPSNLLLYLKYFSSTGVCLNKKILSFIQSTLGVSPKNYNILLGTYDEYQKVIIQIILENEIFYFKIGDIISSQLMASEMDFLRRKNRYKNFDVPEYVTSKESETHNILVTRHFQGEKQNTVCDDAIVKCWKEISNLKDSYEIDGRKMSFSHGDYTPWNIIIRDARPLIYDWEYCGFRFHGFDLIHYNFQIARLVKGQRTNNALSYAINIAKNSDKYFDNIETNELKNLYIEEMKNRGIDLSNDIDLELSDSHK